MSSPIDFQDSVAALLASHLPILVAGGWLIRAPLLSHEEGHEAITRQAWDGLALTDEQRRALLRGVRAPDVSPLGFLISLLPGGQRRHALRAWSRTTTATGIRQAREFLASMHVRALALPDGPRRWATFGELLHCLQDSYSPAHSDRAGARIVRMKHWGPLDGLRRRTGGHIDEHRFPSDPRDSVWTNGSLTGEALAAVAASRSYLEIVLDPATSPDAFGAFLDECVPSQRDEG